MPQIDPKFTFWFGVWTNVLVFVAGYGVEHAPAVVAQYAPPVQWFAGMVAQLNGVILTALIGVSSSKVGPLVSVTAPAAAPPVVKILLAAFVLSAFLAGAPAHAQAPKLKLPIDPLGLNERQSTTKLTGDPAVDLVKALDAKLLPDLQYALKLAQATNSTVTAPCWQAWIDMINTQETAVQTKNPDGSTTDVPLPDPHVITSFERLVELRNALQPESKFMISCSPVASMVKLDIAKFMGVVISGGAGIATLVPGL